MHLHFERNTNTKCDCSILSLSWMGKVPDDIPEDEGWKLNRTNYYQEGWLATGNIRGIVGVTFTTSHCKKNMDYPVRTNYNLRGHRSDVILVKWNEPYQKLASCDSSGIIFVWIKYEGRWSIELINDRNTPVTHFSWSHDGRMALICYQDGFVLVGSVAGQRYWSSMLNLDATITCGIWTPDDQQVYFGTTQGQIIVMDVHGAMVSQVQLCSDVGITAMAWSCEKFKMEEGEDTEPGVTNAAKRSFVLAVSFQNGYIYLLKSFDDVSPVQINTGLNGSLGLVMEWSNSRELLAVAGSAFTAMQPLDSQGNPVYENLLKFYTENGTLLYAARIPNAQTPVSALTWGHNDKRIFIATGNQVHIAWVSRRVASLQLLCRLQIQSNLASEALLPRLPLPSRIKALIGNLFAQTIRCCVPDIKSLREFVSRPPISSTRLHCTMIRHDDDTNLSSGTCYTLYLEYLGGLVPLLKGKRTSKIRPEFVIFDPQIESGMISVSSSTDSSKSSSRSNTSGTIGYRSDSSGSDLDDGCRGSPRTPRKRKVKSKKRPQTNIQTLSSNSDRSRENPESSTNDDELAYVDTLPEDIKLVEVTSNIWGTKFKIHGLAKTVPANLGQVTYKTSLLHLQPRQMTLVITELRDDFVVGPDPTFNPNIFSEDEEEQSHTATVQPSRRLLSESAPPIAPMSPRPNRFTNKLKSHFSNYTNTSEVMGPLARAESYDDEIPFADVNEDSKCSTSSSSSARQGPSYTSFVTQYSRSSSSSGQSRHAISPLCCEGSVPTLQSPKNAVAPSDIIFDRPPAGQTAVMSYASGPADYSGNMMQVKSAIISENNSNRSNIQANTSQATVERTESSKREKLNNGGVGPSKKKDLQYIDEEAPSNATSATPTVPTVASVAISDSITRSCSVGYLDSVQMVPSDSALSILRRDAPNKRLILVDKRSQKKKLCRTELKVIPKLQQTGKSKSLDVIDLSKIEVKPGPLQKNQNIILSGNKEVTEKKSSGLFMSKTPILNRKERPKVCTICKLISPTVNSSQSICIQCRKFMNSHMTTTDAESNLRSILANKSSKKDFFDSSSENSAQTSGTSSSRLYDIKNFFDRKSAKYSGSGKGLINNITKKTEVIKSYADSPLFNRKHRFQESQIKEERSMSVGRKSHKKRDSSGSDEIQSIECITEAKPSVSLPSHAIATLNNIFSRLDDRRLLSTPPGSPRSTKQPRSSPASPAPSKKNKRNQSASPIRHILNSPLLGRRNRKNKQPIESSDDENQASGDENNGGIYASSSGKQYRDLETFQKAQLRQKLKRGKIEPNGMASTSTQSPAPLRREFVMHNKAPMWNENSQVYQLDFGGRVTQESAKNFQIEFRGKQVMQFGRIDGNAYTLDFQYPFSALQAFAVALANVTQRLK